MLSKKILGMGIQKTPVQKIYEIYVGSDSLTVEFYGANRQFDWLYQELPPESDCFSSSNERIYIDLRASYGYTKELEK